MSPLEMDVKMALYIKCSRDLLGGTLVKRKRRGSLEVVERIVRSQCNVKKEEEKTLTLEESQTATVIRKLGLASVSPCSVIVGATSGAGVSAGAGW